MLLKDKFGEFLEYLKKNNYSYSSLMGYKISFRDILSPAIGDIKLKRFHKTDLAKVIELGGQHGEYGAQRAVSHLRCYLKYLHETGTPLPLDYRDIALPKVSKKRIEYLTRAEVAMIREAMGEPSTIRDYRLRAIFETLLASGMRISELLSLNRSDIDWDHKRAVIANAKTKEKNEEVHFTEESLYWLKRYLDARNDNWDVLFTATLGKRMTTCTARNHFRQLAKAMLNKKVVQKKLQHKLLRATFATWLLQGGADIVSVAHLMRDTVRTIERSYLGLDESLATKLYGRIMDTKQIHEEILGGGFRKVSF